MGRLLVLLVFACFTFGSYSQEVSAITVAQDQFNPSDSLLQHSTVNQESLPDTGINRFYYNTELGTSVATNFDGGFGTNLYVAPQLWYMPNRKWEFNISPYIGRSTYNDMPIWINPYQAIYANGSATELGLYAQGLYNINEKLYVGSSVYGQMLIFDNTFDSRNMPDFKSIGSSAFVGYKFSENFRVEAEVGVNRTPNSNFNYIGAPLSPSINQSPRNPYNRF